MVQRPVHASIDHLRAQRRAPLARAAGHAENVTSATRDPVVILGAGLAGLSTARHMERGPALVVEREQRIGGKATSRRRGGHTFDVTGHWLHVGDARVRRLVDELFDPGALVEIERRVAVYSHGEMVPYPFQANLHGLPLEVVRDCLVDFVEAREALARGDGPKPRTLDDFAVTRFGRAIARHFFVPYNTKLWGMHPDRLTATWSSRYIPVPDVAQIMGGAIGLTQEGIGYNARFFYPRAGGIDALPRALARAVDAAAHAEVRLGTEVEQVDVARRRLKLAGQPEAQPYRALVSTIPLPELIARIPAVPGEIARAASALRSVPWRYLDVATKSPSPMPYHWVYVPENHIPFFRVGVYSNVVEAMAPPGGGSLYVELADRKAEPVVTDVLAALATMGAIASPEDVRFWELHDVEHAYVLFDDVHGEATHKIRTWLEHVGVRSCGRYGAWTYCSMEDAIISGMEAAEWANGS
jgi:protoporphyrinogen oxidase